MESTTEHKKDTSFKETVRFILLAIVFIVIFRVFIAQPFIVDGASMDPTFDSGNYLIVDQLSYRLGKPDRGEVVIFRYPISPKVFFIKRVIGLPGETVSMRDGKITIKNAENPNGMIIPDTHVDPSKQTDAVFNVTLGPTEYFVMGDNRRESSDSRQWGPLEEENIVGRPFVRLYPLSRIEFFPGI